MANAVLDDATGELLEYRHLIRHLVYQEVWGKSMGKEIDSLSQGLDGVVKGTDTLTRSSKRQQRAPTCPVCVTAKMRRAPAPTTSSSTKYPQPWQKVYIDLSGKMRVRSYTNAYYFIVFVCDYSGARYCDFVAKKSDFIIAYRRFLQHLQVVPKEIHTDKGGEFSSTELADLLLSYNTNHIMCAPGEHFEIGPAESAVGNLRTTARCLLLDANVPKTYWPFAIGHACYLSNLTSRCRADSRLTVFEFLFQTSPNLSRIPPFGCFAASYRDRRSLKDQSWDLSAKPGFFLGINRYDKQLGYCIGDNHSVWVTRHHISFDRHFFPLRTRASAATPNWQTFHSLVQDSSAASVETPLEYGPPEDPLAYDDAPASTADSNEPILHAIPLATPQPEPILPAIPLDNHTADTKHTPPASTVPATGTNFTKTDAPGNEHTTHTPALLPEQDMSSDDVSSSSDDENGTTSTITPTHTRPSRAAKDNFKLAVAPRKTRKPRVPTAAEVKYTSDPQYKAERDSYLGKEVQKYFPTHAKMFKGKVQHYHYATDTYTILFEDDDQETMTYSDLQLILPDSNLYNQDHLAAQVHLAFCAAALEAEHALKQKYSEPLTYNEALAAPDADRWISAMNTEMTNLRSRCCWEVIPRSSLPPHAKVMLSRWIYKYKTDEQGNLIPAIVDAEGNSQEKAWRARFVVKGYSQIENVNYWETFAPVSHAATIRFIFALTAVPGFLCVHFDVSVAFIEAPMDPNEPPLYCTPPDGFENKKDFVYVLRKHLYGLKQAPRGWALKLRSILIDFGLTRLHTDEAVFLLRRTNLSSNCTTRSSGSVPPHLRMYSDCAHEEVILILVTYVDDILAFSNSQQLIDEFSAHCNRSVKMNCEGPVKWYLSVKYDRDPNTGAVCASQSLYINKLLRQYGLESCNPLPTPFPSKTDALLKQLAITPSLPNPALRTQFQKLMGSLLYIQQHTVPEISLAVSILSRYLINPADIHMTYAKKVLRYLKGRVDLPLRWCASSCREPHQPGLIYGYSDASFADVLPLRHSTIGYVFLCNNAAVSWRSTRSSMVALNTAEAELISLSSATQEAIYLRKLALELGFIQENPTILYQDNAAAAALSRDVRFRNRSKHIALRWAYVCERQLLRDVQVIKIPRQLQLADLLVSPRSASSFLPYRAELLGLTGLTEFMSHASAEDLAQPSASHVP